DPAAHPDVPPADAARIAAAQDAAAAASERELSTPASSGLGSGTVEPDATPETGAGARDQPVSGNEPVTPAGPTAVPGARPAPSAEPVASSADEPASDAPASDEPGSTAAGSGGGGNGKKIVLAVVLVLLLLAVIVFGVRYLMGGSANAEAGDCVSLSAENDDRAQVDTLDCTDAKASYQVGKVLDATDGACPEEGLYTEIVPAGGAGDGYKLCLLPNMAEGGCYKPDEGTGFVKTECTGPETIKVTKVIKGSTDLEACPDGAGMAYPEPSVTYCLAPAEM
ncbi:hypothetical protein AB0G02_12385, partial [Actinosynnema sp. NPDC023658]|uniref:LppU/SCO3897 family protein n=1 Tax=Actinosynnema sp. NPDC023658 TaxID=3155465 RepID=UPI003403E821